MPDTPGSCLKHLRVLPECLTQAIVAPNNFVQDLLEGKLEQHSLLKLLHTESFWAKLKRVNIARSRAEIEHQED